MKRTVFLSLVFLLLGGIVFAQEEDPAMGVVEKVALKLGDGSDHVFTFSMNISNKKANFEKTTSGRLVANASSFHLSLEEPNIEIVQTKESKMVVQHDDEEIMISSVNLEDEEDFSFLKYLSDVEENYTLTSTEPLPGILMIKLIPREEYSDLAFVEMKINTRGYSLMSLSEHDNEGTVRFFDVQSQTVLSDYSFEVSTSGYPQYDVTDLR